MYGVKLAGALPRQLGFFYCNNAETGFLHHFGYCACIVCTHRIRLYHRKSSVSCHVVFDSLNNSGKNIKKVNSVGVSSCQFKKYHLSYEKNLPFLPLVCP